MSRDAYRMRSAKPEGIDAMTLRAGDGGRASIVVNGRGPALGVPVLPLGGPVHVVLVKDDGSEPCWEATHDLLRTNKTRRFVATNR